MSKKRATKVAKKKKKKKQQRTARERKYNLLFTLSKTIFIGPAFTQTKLDLLAWCACKMEQFAALTQNTCPVLLARYTHII